MRRNFPKLATAAICATLAAQPALSATAVSAAYPESIVNAIQDLGYKAILTTDSYGDPLIRSAASGVEFVIGFYNCENNTDCADLHFSVIFDMPDGFDIFSVNSWNKEKLIGMAYLDDENDPALQHYIAAVDGMSRDNFVATFSQWTESLAEFTDFIDW